MKVSLARNIWRRIEVAADHTLYELHMAIQDAFEFANDNLYSFFLDGERWSRERFSSSDDDEGPYVTEVRIGELGLAPGQNVLYLFDYGDEWWFKLVVEDIRTHGRKPREPRIIGKKGEAPEQYGFYE